MGCIACLAPRARARRMEGIVHRFAVFCGVSVAFLCIGCAAAFWTSRVPSFRWSVPLGNVYTLVLQHGDVYIGPHEANCEPAPRECEKYPINHRTLSLHYLIGPSEYPLLTIPLPDH